MNRKLIDINESAGFRHISRLAAVIWPYCYRNILAPGQIEYMLEAMYSEEQMRSDLVSGIIHRLLLVDGHAAGFIAFGAIAPETLKLHKLYLLPDLHGQGHGRYMVDHVVAYGLEHHFRHLCLCVNRNNQAAIKFYRRYGFIVAEEKKTDIGNGFYMDDYIMALTLSSDSNSKGISS